MIIVKLMGGLGNQMFQYAAGRRLAMKHNTELKLDLSYLQNQTQRKNFTIREYELGYFNLKSNIARKEEINGFIQNEKSIRSKILRIFRLTNIIKDFSHTINKRVLSATDNSYLVGYWQSEAYFKNIAETIYNDFTLKREFQNNYQNEFAKKVDSCSSVSLHIRRGDYVSDNKNFKIHGICSLEYYQKAVEKFANKLDNPQFFVFSDDIEWAKENLKFAYQINFMEHRQDSKSFEDLILMSLCKHNIIANSTYSWWGAWLNRNPEKIVISPKRLTANKRRNKQKSTTLIPEGWIRL